MKKLALAGLFFFVAASPATAWRLPTLRERVQITNWYPRYIRNAPVRCVHIDIRISSRDARYAFTYAQVLNWKKPRSGCIRYASNGFYILKRTRKTWRLVYQGSDDPPCSLRIPRDLVKCRR